MSCFVVDSAHIDLLVRLALVGPSDGVNCLPGMGRFPLRWWVPAPDGATELSVEDRAIEALTGERPVNPRMVMQGAECRLVATDAAPGEIDPSQLGALWLTENVRSVMHAYPDTIDSGELPGSGDQWSKVYKWTDPKYTPTCAEASALIRSYAYQACEHPSWRESEAFLILSELTDAVLASLPGVEATPWNWDSDSIAEVRARRA